MKRAFKRLLLALLSATLAGAASAQEIVAVLGSDMRPYRETFASCQAAFGRAVPVLPLGAEIPDSAKVVLAFGAKAAIEPYPGRVTLIYAIAPGLLVTRKTHPGPSVKIKMEPEAGALLGRLREIQPGLKRLAVLWTRTSAVRAADAERLVRMGAARGVAVSSERLDDAGDLPDRLRALEGRIDAIWLPPDPLLISAGNFDILKHYSYDNDVPLYAPTAGLAEQGATAGVSVTYEEMGRTMAAAAKAALSGAALTADLHSEKVHVSINRVAAAEADLEIPAEALRFADKVFP